MVWIFYKAILQSLYNYTLLIFWQNIVLSLVVPSSWFIENIGENNNFLGN